MPSGDLALVISHHHSTKSPSQIFRIPHFIPARRTCIWQYFNTSVEWTDLLASNDIHLRTSQVNMCQWIILSGLLDMLVTIIFEYDNVKWWKTWSRNWLSCTCMARFDLWKRRTFLVYYFYKVRTRRQYRVPMLSLIHIWRCRRRG